MKLLAPALKGTQVLTPVATGLHAAEQHAKQRTLFLEGGKYCLALGLFFVTLFICLGQPLLDLWMGRALLGAWPLLVILGLGELLAMSQWITYSMILGMGRHKLTACFNMLEGVLILGSALALAEPYGLIGMALAVAVPGAVCRGLAPLLYGCRLVQVPVGAYLLRAFAPPLLVAAGPALLLGLAVAWHAPRTWPELVGYTAIFSAVYFVLCAFAVVGRQRIARLLPRLRRPSPPLPAAPPLPDARRTAITEHGPEGVLAS